MSAIEKMTITCTTQEDWTGSDDLDFYIDSVYLGRLTMTSGETRTVDGPGLLFGDTIYAEAGQTLTIKEFDAVDPSDVLLSHTISDSDIDAPTITLHDQSASADYTFEITFIRF
jgi:hypothetical protein